jgi:hypothetical protein
MRTLVAPLVLVSCVAGSVLVTLLAIPMTILSETILRGRCPHCQRRGLRGGRVLGDATLHGGDSRNFFWSECDHCHHQFHRFDDGTSVHIPPDDSRYVTIV